VATRHRHPQEFAHHNETNRALPSTYSYSIGPELFNLGQPYGTYGLERRIVICLAWEDAPNN